MTAIASTQRSSDRAAASTARGAADHGRPLGASTSTGGASTSTDWVELAEELLYAVGGVGLGFMTYLAMIPGLLPALILVAGAGALLVLPLLVIGLVLSAVAGVIVVLVRLGSRVFRRNVS